MKTESPSIRQAGPWPLLLLALAVVGLFAATLHASYTKEDSAVTRIEPAEARSLVTSGRALLVCAYGDDSCKSKMLEGALLRSELDAKLPTLPREQTLIFYCG